GVLFGPGDGSTTFNLPDAKGCTIAHVDGGAGRLTGALTGGVLGLLGSIGGLEGNALTAAQLASHAHPAYARDKGHAHPFPNSAAGLFSGANWGGAPPATQGLLSGTNNGFADIEIRSAPGTGGNANVTDVAGGGQPHNNVQPTI